MRVRPGTRIVWRDDDYEVIAVGPLAATLRSHDGGELEVSIDELNSSARYSQSELRGWSATAVLDYEEANGELRIWCDALGRLEGVSQRHGALSRAIAAEAERVGDRLGRPVSTRTVWRKLRAFKEEGPAGVMDQRSQSARTSRAVDARVVEVLNTVLASRARASTVSKAVLMNRVADLVQRQFGDSVTMPSRATFYRLFEAEDRGRHSFGSAKTRESLALRPEGAFGGRPILRPGEHVQIDTTKLDVLVRIDESRIERPELTVMIDVATRSILAAVLRPVATKSMDLLVVLARALVPYGRRPEGARETRRLISTAWAEDALIDQDRYEHFRFQQPFIFPETITTDRGRTYLSAHFHAVCEQLGISLNPAAPYTPTDKAHIERTFGSIASLFLQYATGYVGRSTEYRGRDVDRSSDGILTIAQMQELLEDWVAVHWQTRPHDGLRDPLHPTIVLSPNEMCRAYRHVVPELHVALTREDFIALLPVVHRRINRYGVTIDHRVYDSKRLAEYRQRLSPVTNMRGRWPIRVDPYNLHVVWLEVDGEYIPLRWGNEIHDMPMAGEVWRHARHEYRERTSQDSEDSLSLVAAMRRFAEMGNARRAERVAARADASASDPMNLARDIEAGADRDIDDVAQVLSDETWPNTGGFELTSEDVDAVRWRLED